jgi:hypothetical protein
MGYNVNLEKIRPIFSKTAAVGTDILAPITTENDLRITVPSLLVMCGATGQTLTVLQVKTLDYAALDAAGGQNIVTVVESEGSQVGRQVALQLPDESWFFAAITATNGKQQTLSANLPAGGVKKDARVMIFNLPSEDGNNQIPLEASKTTLLQAPCPGLFAARDIGFPMILHLTNGTNQARILGGMAAYIGK